MADDTTEDRLPLPGVVNWPNFPFEGELRVKAVEPPADAEDPRFGEPGGGECQSCAATDDDYLWTNDRWRLKTLAPFSPLPVSLILETRDHIDLNEFDDDLAADLGRWTVDLTRMGEARPEVGRMHTYRWGDGGSHFHIWFLGRPFGAKQLLGLTLPLWGLTLPPLDTAVTDPINQALVDAISESRDTRAH